MISDMSVSLNLLLIWVTAAIGLALALCIGFSILEPRWASLLGFMLACSHGLATRRWIGCLKERERAAFELGQESVRSIR